MLKKENEIKNERKKERKKTQFWNQQKTKTKQKRKEEGRHSLCLKCIKLKIELKFPQRVY